MSSLEDVWLYANPGLWGPIPDSWNSTGTLRARIWMAGFYSDQTTGTALCGKVPDNVRLLWPPYTYMPPRRITHLGRWAWRMHPLSSLLPCEEDRLPEGLNMPGVGLGLKGCQGLT